MDPTLALSKLSQPAPGRLSASSLRDWLRLLPGLALSAVLAAVAIRLGAAGWLPAHGMTALTVAIVLGILLGNTVYPFIAASSGITDVIAAASIQLSPLIISITTTKAA